MTDTTLDFSSLMPVGADALFRWHAQPGAFQRLTPPWAPVRLETFEGIEEGQVAVIRLGAGPVSIRWEAVHSEHVEGRQFVDRQRRGPFARWQHVHRMEPLGPDACRLHDHLTYALPLGALGNRIAGAGIKKELRRQFAYRHRITHADLTAHARYSTAPMRIAITGATGLIGTALTHFLTTGGHTVVPISRSRDKKSPPETVLWNPRTGEIEKEKLEGLDAVIHLAGENLFAIRWTQDKKERILGSRVNGTELLARTLADLERKPGVLLSASGVGIYGDRGDALLDEQAAPAEAGFLSLVCRQWEQATRAAEDADIRVAHMRTAVVLTPKGGALELMLPAFKMGLGGRVGDKGQWFPWIALDDVLGGYLHALTTPDISGPVNLAAPHPVTMDTFAGTLADVLNRPAVFNVPTPLLRLVSGEAADEMLLQSTRVVPRVLEDTGYAFRFPHMEEALRHMLGKTEDFPDQP